MSYAQVLVLVFMRVLKVLALAVPTLLVLILASAMGPGGSGGGFAIFLTLALCGLAWAFLPIIHASFIGGLLFGMGWLGLAAGHVITSAGSVTGAVVVCWLLATLFLAIKLKAQPPGYFPPGRRGGAASPGDKRHTAQ